MEPRPSSLLPPPPPPPPIQVCLTKTALSTDPHATKTPSDLHRDNLDSLVQRLQPAVCNSSIVTVSHPVQYQLQNGPKCGLVALSMASSLCGDSRLEVADLLSLARSLGFTNHGEVFSVDFMLELASSALPHSPAQIVTAEQLADPQFVALRLAAGDVFLVPYDSDRNFSPACLQGHKAHWALLTGILVTTSQALPEGSGSVLHLLPGPSAATLLPQLITSASPVLHVLALQGKSRHLAAWPLSDLVASNGNLVQMDPMRENSDLTYIVPEGGIVKGLCGRALLLQFSKSCQ